jgi:hypothetical protein
MKRFQMGTSALAGDARILARPSIGRLTALIVMLIGAATASVGEGALVSSSKSFSQQMTNSFYIQSYAYIPNGTPIYQRPFGGEGKLLAGVASATVTTDTAADTGVVDAMELTPFSLTPSSKSGEFSTSITVVEEPANFPLPAVTHTYSGQWQEIISFNGVTGDSPTFASSAAAALTPYIGTPPWFSMVGNVTFTVPSFTLTGTYQVVGPESTTTVPFSVEFEPEVQPANSSIAIRGGETFGPDFNFILLETSVVYRPVNPQIFDGVVDGMRFDAQFYEFGTAVAFCAEQSGAGAFSILSSDRCDDWGNRRIAAKADLGVRMYAALNF